MTALWFLTIVAVIVVGVFATEREGPPTLRAPTGLLTWFVTGNWPAKIGAALMIVGGGALLRYAAVNIEVAPVGKLATGVALAAALAFVSTLVKAGPAQRAVSLALGGAAFGVVYLTAYAAYALFGYLNNATGVGLLGVTAIAAGAFAVRRSALSVALLAMIGAWLAPAFALTDPGPYVVYGYYAAVSALTLVMVALRGWRPLIHLSFLFTLVGGVLFAWNASYYSPEHFDAMSLMLWLLVGLHVAMPLVEGAAARGRWLQRLDTTYLIALPLVAALLAFAISPTSTALAIELALLGLIWTAAAALLHRASREGAWSHAAIGVLLILGGAATRFTDLPWDVLALALTVIALRITVASGRLARAPIFAGLILVIALAHGVVALTGAGGRPFLNGQFYEQLSAAALLVLAARICRKARISTDVLLLCAGAGWAVVTIAIELMRWDRISIALVAHWLALAASIGVYATRRQVGSPALIGGAVAAAVTGLAAADATPALAAVVTLLAAPIAMTALAMRAAREPGASVEHFVASLAAIFLAGVWAARVAHLAGMDNAYIMLTASAAASVLTLIASPVRSRTAAQFSGLAFAIVLGFAAVINISRDPWAIALETVCLAGLGLLAFDKRAEGERPAWVSPAAIIAIALLAQAHLLRLFGPAGALSAADIARMDHPVIVSLLWATMGAALTITARRTASRSVWIGGAALLIGAAVKLVLIDIGARLGALGELTNIVAVMAAGAAFLLVGWLAPMPPKAASEEPLDLEGRAPAASSQPGN